ncbi:hypothetical protein KY343_02855 [Candidatus Woesearchaeota archaeon]|nr:hypothetical protein [Candidatus Woesearchaeota archaeon]
MGGNSALESIIALLKRCYDGITNVCNSANNILNKYVLSQRYISKLEKDIEKKDSEAARLRRLIQNSTKNEIASSERMISIERGYKEERFELATKVTDAEAENERLEVESDKRNQTIAGLEEKLASTQGDLTFAQTELGELKKDHKKTCDELTEVKQGIEYYWSNAHQQFQKAIKGLRTFYEKAGMEVDEETLAKSVGGIMQRMKEALKEANMRLDEAEVIKKNGILADALMDLDETKPIVVLGINNIVEAASISVESLFDKRYVGEYADSIYDGLAVMISYAAETHEEGFDFKLRDKIAKVRIRRVNNHYIGAILTFEERMGLIRSWLSKKDRIREGVSKALLFGEKGPFIINLTNIENPDQITSDTSKRLYSLAASDYFRENLRIKVGSQEVYTALEKKHGIPYSMLIYDGGFRFSSGKGKEGTSPEEAKF